MKQLFLKSNILHIRTNEGEFEVSNPEVIPSKMKNYVDAPEGLFSPVEWPHGVERVSDCSCQVNKTRCWGPCGADTTVKIRLLPEEKKHEWTTDEIMSMVEKKPAKVESSEPQENQELKEAVAGQETLALDLCRCMDLLNRCYWNMMTFVPSDKTMSHAEWMDCLNELELFRTEHPPTKFSNIKKPIPAPSESQEDMRTKLQRYQQTLIARYYNNDLTEKEKIDLNKIIDELSDLLK